MQSNIPKLVKRSNKTVTELATEAGVSRSIMSQLANSDAIPDKTRFDALVGISTALNVSIHELYEDDNQPYVSAVENLGALVTVKDKESGKPVLLSGIIQATIMPMMKDLYFSYRLSNMESSEMNVEMLEPTFEIPVLNSLLKVKNIDSENTFNSEIKSARFLDRKTLRKLYADVVESQEFNDVVDSVYTIKERPWNFKPQYAMKITFQRNLDGVFSNWDGNDNDNNKILFDAYYRIKHSDGESDIKQISKDFQDIAVNSLLDDLRSKGMLPNPKKE